MYVCIYVCMYVLCMYDIYSSPVLLIKFCQRLKYTYTYTLSISPSSPSPSPSFCLSLSHTHTHLDCCIWFGSAQSTASLLSRRCLRIAGATRRRATPALAAPSPTLATTGTTTRPLLIGTRYASYICIYIYIYNIYIHIHMHIYIWTHRCVCIYIHIYSLLVQL